MLAAAGAVPGVEQFGGGHPDEVPVIEGRRPDQARLLVAQGLFGAGCGGGSVGGVGAVVGALGVQPGEGLADAHCDGEGLGGPGEGVGGGFSVVVHDVSPAARAWVLSGGGVRLR